MPNDPSDRIEVKKLREVITAFVHGRAAPKLEKIEKELASEEDFEKRDALEQKRSKLLESYSVGNWLASASQRVRQILIATHTVRYTNPLITKPTSKSLNVKRNPVGGASGFVATSGIADVLKEDVVADTAAVLDVNKFLQLAYNSRTLLDRVLERDPTLAAALSDSPEQAAALMDAFAGVVRFKGKPATDTLLRQLYFPLPDGSYHLLAPLYPTSLAFEVRNRLNDSLFTDAAKEARQAQREGLQHSEGYVEFRDLGELRFGGANAQNVSQFNTDLQGQAWLLPSSPPAWKTRALTPPRGKSVFGRSFDSRQRVRFLLRSLADYLGATNYTNIHIRRGRARLVEALTDELWQFASELGELAPGWSAAADCALDREEALWLDPGRAQQDPEFAQALTLGQWREEVARRFGRWLNKQLREKSKQSKELPMGDAEFHQWTSDVKDVIKQLEKELAYD